MKPSNYTKYESKVYTKGKTTLPLEIRKQLGISDNEKLIYIKKGDLFEITTNKRLLEQMQAKLRLANDNYSVDDFIAERRHEALEEEMYDK
jgi:bifunctional DNA-binding transcriptional regulator/antitoxin component of YhaV-PrlF toxin-antitoxin module